MSRKFLRALRALPTALFVLGACCACVYHGSFLTKQLSITNFQSKSLEKFGADLEKNLPGKFSREFINLNGLVARELGINSLNDVERLQNGWLLSGSDNSVSKRAREHIKKVGELGEFFQAANVPFLYVMCPTNGSFESGLRSPGYSSSQKLTEKAFIKMLQERKINYIHAGNELIKRGMSFEDAYFKTDHHWRPEAAFLIYDEIMKNLEANYGFERDAALCDIKNWKTYNFEKGFLGTRGRRVGKYYAGVDDILLISSEGTEKADFSFLRANNTWVYQKGTVGDISPIKGKKYFNCDSYTILYSSDEAAVLKYIHNQKAVNSKKIVIFGDSYARPIFTFLSAQFSDVYFFDLRFYKESGTFMDFIRAVQPDLMIRCLSTGEFANVAHHNFGLDEYLDGLRKTNPNAQTEKLGDQALSARSNKEQFTVLRTNLRPNQYYTLTADGVALSKKDGFPGEYVQFTLQNLANNKPVCNRYLSTKEGGTQKWIFKTPKDANGSYAIYMYAGTKGATQDIAAEVKGITLREGIQDPTGLKIVARPNEQDRRTARIDVKLNGENAKFELLEKSDDKATATVPGWFQNNGKGYQVESGEGKINLTFKAETDGSVDIWLRGRDIREQGNDKKRVPVWIDYTSFKFNGKEELNGTTAAWHDEPKRLSHRVKKGETITIEAAWELHK